MGIKPMSNPNVSATSESKRQGRSVASSPRNGFRPAPTNRTSTGASRTICLSGSSTEARYGAVEGVPIKVALINNGNLGMVRQWQTLFYDQRYSNTELGTHGEVRIPDFVKLAEALGCVGIRVEREEDVEPAIRQAQAINDRPVVIDFIVGKDAQVWPMVAAGTSNDEIMAARGIRPLFDDDEAAAEPAVIHEAMYREQATDSAAGEDRQ